jgi:simple sugar transport system permease protein
MTMAEAPLMTTNAETAAPPPIPAARRVAVAAGFAVIAIAVLLIDVAGRGSQDDASFRFSDPGETLRLPDVTVPAGVAGLVLALLILGLAGWHAARGFTRRAMRWVWVAVTLLGVLGFLVWAATGQAGTVIDVTGLLSTTLFLAVPLVLGAMAGIVSERSGVINVAIEGKMLAGAFAAALFATLLGSLLAGVIAAAIVGALVGALLAVFALRYLVNQVVLGVVINLLVLGLTTYLYSSVLQRNAQSLNSPGFYAPVRIPVLADIPVLGQLLFTQNLLVYTTYVIVIAVHLALFRTRWGLRTRAVGEHPQAADTVGIDVNRLRFRNVIIAGAIAGIAGAYVSIGTVGSFSENMTAGRGFIALAAVIFGRWSPGGAVAASLLFAFTTALQTTLGIIGTPVEIPSQFLAMLPYLATIAIVAGVVGRVRAPAADGIPYVK